MNRAVAVRVAAVVLVAVASGCGLGDGNLVYMATGARTGVGTDSGTGGDTGVGTDSGTGGDTGGGTGTWDDSVSGLTWQNPPYTGSKNWSEAKSYCASLSLAGGGWRLPTISELRSLIRGCAATQTGGSCGVTDSCLSYSGCRGSSCDGCSSGAGPANGCYWPDEMEGTCGWYWSSSPVADRVDRAFDVGFGLGHVDSDYADIVNYVRCVR